MISPDSRQISAFKLEMDGGALNVNLSNISRTLGRIEGLLKAREDDWEYTYREIRKEKE